MEITNYFDIKFIVNLSISITISLFVVFVLGKVFTDIFSETIKFLLKTTVKSFLKRVSPPTFSIGFPLDRISANKIQYEKHKIINFGKLTQTFLPATGIDLFIVSSAKLPFLYEGSKTRIQIVDAKELLGIYSAQKLPSKPTTFILGESVFESTIVCHIHIDLKPVKTFENYKIPVNIFCQGKIYKEEIFLTVKAE